MPVSPWKKKVSRAGQTKVQQLKKDHSRIIWTCIVVMKFIVVFFTKFATILSFWEYLIHTNQIRTFLCRISNTGLEIPVDNSQNFDGFAYIA